MFYAGTLPSSVSRQAKNSLMKTSPTAAGDHVVFKADVWLNVA
jgi:hypothetical protein